jgi:perosamine synthetase
VSASAPVGTRAEAAPAPARERYRGGVLRHQLPVHSPLPAQAVLYGVPAALGIGTDPRPELARLLRSRFHAEEVLLCSSGTAALQLAIHSSLARAGRGVVALPAFSCFDVAAAALPSGAPLTFYDVDPATLGPDPDSLRSALRQGAGVVVAGPLYGIPFEWHPLRGLCDEAGAILIEDAAQGAGAHLDDRRLGSLGAASVISFGRGKGWTGGGGGALLLREGTTPLAGPPAPDRRAEAVLLASAALQLALARPGLYRIPLSIPGIGLGETVWHDARPPRELTRAAAALALASASVAERENEYRAARGAELARRISEIDGIQVVHPPTHSRPTYLRFPALAPGGIHGLADPALARRLGVAPSYPSPLPRLPQLRGRLLDTGTAFPGAEQLARELVTLPTHSRLSAAELEQLLRVLHTRRAVAPSAGARGSAAGDRLRDGRRRG